MIGPFASRGAPGLFLGGGKQPRRVVKPAEAGHCGAVVEARAAPR
jgi:hypothetical protein